MKYNGVPLPDPVIVKEMERAGELFRTDIDDVVACGRNPSKIGPDNDKQPGGCDNVRIQIQAGEVKAAYARISD